MSSINYKFLQQQGFKTFNEQDSEIRVNALQFQPSIVGSLILVATIFQLWPLFLVISFVLWINVLFPRANPFENIYNRVFITKKDSPKIDPAPGPRRFAQGMAAVFTLGAVICMLQSWSIPAYIFQGMLLLAFSLLLFVKFCLGSYLYHLLKGNASFANATCPWAH